MATKRLFRIQYASNLHLQCYDKAPFPLLVKPAARYLALAGNIGEPRSRIWNSFFDYASSNWDQVFYVPGEQEYSKSNGPQTLGMMQQHIRESLVNWNNVTYFHPKTPRVFIPTANVAIVGNTHNPHDMRKHIAYYTYQKIPMIVLTHYLPSLELMHYYNLVTPYVRFWIYGDTHTSDVQYRGDIICTNNARGYPNEYINGFSKAATIEFATREEEGANPELAAAAL